MRYNPQKIEKKWQKYWQTKKLYHTKDTVKGKKNYMLLTEFPYPSGNLHMGHWYAFSLPDIRARYLRMQGHNVMYPIGFDAFGLPAENAAIKRNIHPRDWTRKNIAFMSKQLQSMGAMFDWSRVVSTMEPEYYQWTQWIFLRMHEKGLAYRAATKANWCPKDKTVLANEQVVDGKCERCDTPVEQKNIEQWMFKITEYADRLVDDIEGLDWPNTTKLAQQNWINRSEGAKIKFFLADVPGQKDSKHFVEVFTTRADTLFGVTAVVISPELAQKWIEVGWQASAEVSAYIRKALGKRELDRLEQTAEKTGVPAGIHALNPANGEKVPVWVADYVLGNYGTGAVMMVPAHDERDFAFAQKFNIPIKVVIEPITGEVHDDEEYRQSIVALVKNPKTGKFLSLNWGSLGGSLLVGGGLEKGEDPLQCAMREIQEETGYKNLRFIEKSETIHHHYRAHSKKVNRFIDATGFYFELIDEEQLEVQQTEEEKGKFKIEWLDQKDLSNSITDLLHGYVFQRFTRREAFTEDGILVGSGKFDSLSSFDARTQIVEHLKKEGKAEFQKNYRLRDWILSRQRYWGVPIPMIKCAECGFVPVPDKDLPVKLPPLKDFLPSDDGRSPLAKATAWLKVKCPSCKGPAERETDTMDTFVDSSWYFYRYTDPKNKKKFADLKKMKAWLPVPMYVGGAEHNTMHLLYSRFFNKVLFDLGLVPSNEPFAGRRNHGIILGPDGQKMSKSRGNVIDPDKEVAQYGADTVRMYLAFMSPYEQGGPWDPKGINGVYRFLSRVFNLVSDYDPEKKKDSDSARILAVTTKEITGYLERLQLNTCVSSLMKLLNYFSDLSRALSDVKTEKGTFKYKIGKEEAEIILKLLAPFAPHLAEELWINVLKKKKSIHLESWPNYDEKYLVQDMIDMPVQVNGKVRDVLKVSADVSEDKLKELALASENVKKHLASQTIRKIIVVPKRLISIVI